MKQAILLIGFTKFKDSELDDKAELIIERMTANSLFPTPTPPLTDMSTALADFRHTKTLRRAIPNYGALMKLKRSVLINVMTELGHYISDLYPGNVVNWLTTGYDVQTFEGNVQVPPVPGDVRIMDGKYPGQLMLLYKESKDALYYEGTIVDDEGRHPLPGVTTSKTLKMTFENLEVGKRYGLVVRAHGTKGVSAWSPPLFRFAQ